MSPTLMFDHAIIAVRDLDQAAADFRGLGFTLVYGGQHANGETHNTLIAFPDGSYFELLAPTDPALLTSEKLASSQGLLKALANGESWAGFAFVSPDLAEDTQAMLSRGLSVSAPAENGRRRPDGELLMWRASQFEGNLTPFFIEDLTPRTLRVPQGEHTIHANGAIGMAEVVIAVHDLEDTLRRYRAMLGMEPEAGTARFVWNNAILSFVSAADDGVAAYLEQYGEVPYLLKLRTSDPARVGLLDLPQTHGACIEFVV